MKYLEGLNGAQREAVLTTDGPVAVLAGAGAGKTRVLTSRIYRLIREGTPPEAILAVTFTNKAAREMRDRVRSMLETDVAHGTGPFIATFHGLGRRLLETYGSRIGIPRFFGVYDREDSEKAVAAALKELDIGSKEFSPRAVLSKISRAKGEGMRAQEFHETHARSGYGNRIAAEAWLRYERALTKEKSLDFDDLIALPTRLLEAYDDIRARAQELWRYIHIDEYQDTNALQGRLASLLAGKHGNIFVVGDIDQTIYTWRGATIENLLAFDATYPNARTIVLEQNYRATKNLVDAANSIIEKNKNRKEKRSTTGKGPGAPIRLHLARSAEGEARWIARNIREMMRKGEKPESVAVLFRTNMQSRALEEGLLREGVPYRILGTRFFERREVKDVLAWVRLALDPSREADKMRAAASPPRGLGKVVLGKLVAGKRGELREGERARVEAFESVIDELARAAETLPPSDLVKLVIEKSGMRRALLDEGSADDRERFENIEELASVAARHDAEPGKGGLTSFLAEAALASDQDALDLPSARAGTAQAGRGDGKSVTLMTVHAAKGLEFDTVFVSGMEEGLFPHEGANGDENRDEEEERRLFYVAMTRAKEQLILTLASVRKIYGTDFITEPSSFLRDLPAGSVVYEDDEEIIEA